jgi:hypothetical protein
MFETEDGIVNVDSLSLEDQIVFFERYPNAKLVKEEDLKIVARENPTAAKPSDMQFGSDVEEIKLKSDVDMAKIREDVRVAEIRTTKPKSIELEEFEEIYEEDRDKRINEFRQAEFYASRDSNVIPTQDGYVIGEASKDKFDNDETWKDYQKWVESGRIETYDELDLDFQIEKQYELNDLNIDLDKTNIYYNPQKNTSFVDTHYDAELLEKMNVNIDDFQGLLNKKGLTEDFSKKINRGTFDEKSVEQGKRENLLLSKEMLLSTYLDIYLNDIDEKANKKAFIEEYNYNKNKYKDFETFDEAYSSFIKEKGGKFTTFNLDAYTEYQTKALPNLSKAASQLDKDQALLMDKRSKQSNAEGAIRGLGETAYEGGAMFVSGAKELTMWLNDIFPTPISTKVNEQKRLIQMAEQYKDAKNKLQYMNVSGKSVDYNGVNYLKDDNGTLYNTTTGLTIGESISDEEKQKILDKIDKEGVDDFDFSLRGFSNFAGAVLGDVAFQILGTKGVTGARLAASTKALAKANGFKNVAQFKNFQKLAYMPKVKNAGTFGVKLPMDARYIDAAFAQGIQGAFKGYNSTLLEAKRAGLTDSEAEKLANSASLQLGVLYTLTGPINPKLPMINKLDDWLLGKSVINDALKSYVKTGSKKVFNESLGNSIKKLIPTKRSAIRVFNEGFKEFGQEDIQQRAENFVINRSINNEAGMELLKADYSVDDFIGTSVLSFSIGSLTSGGLRIPGFKSDPHARLRNLYEVSLNPEKSKRMLAVAVSKGTISQEVADDIMEQATAVGLGLKKAPSFMGLTPDLMIEWSQKYSELQQELKKKEELHESGHDLDKIAKINLELKDIVERAREEVAVERIEKDASTVGKIQKKLGIGETIVLRNDQDFKNNNVTKEDIGNALFKSKEGKIYVNLSAAVANFDISAPSHELLHQIISQEFTSKDGELDPRVKKVVDDFKQVLKNKGVFSKVDDRMKVYRDKADEIRREGQDEGLSEAEIQVKIKEFGGLDIDNVDSDEWITQFFSLVSEGEIKFDELGEKTWLQIGKEILETLAVKLGVNADKLKFNSGQEVFDFVLDYEKAISKGKLTAKARRGLKDFKKDKSEKRSLSLLENINNLVPKNVSTKEEFQSREVFNPIFNATQPGGAIYNYVNSRALSKEEAEITLEGVVDRLINFDPAAIRKTASGDPITFGEFLFANARFSKLDAKKRLAIESERQAESLDTEEARQVAEPAAETTTTEAPRVEYKNLVESRVLPNEMVAKVQDKILLITKTLKSRIDAATSINKTVTPLMSEIKKEIGKQADIEFKKMLGAKRGGELRNNFLKLKKPILENMTTTWLMQGMPFAIQKSVDGKFTSDWEGKKIDRESVGTDKAGRTSGAQLVRRLPNAANKITDEQFLTYMFKGDEVIRGRKEALAKALAEEYAFDVYNEEFKNPNSEIVEAFKDNQSRLGAQLFDNYIQEFSKQAERGSVKRSISLNAAERSVLVDSKNVGPIMKEIRALEMGLKFTEASAKKIIINGYKDKGIEESKLKEIAKEYAASLKKYVDSRETIGTQLDLTRFIKNHIDQKEIKASGEKNIANITGFAETFDEVFDGKFVNISDDRGVQEANRATTQEYTHKLIDEGGESGFINAFKFMKGHTATAYVVGGKRAQYFSGLKDLIDNVFNTHSNIEITYTIPEGGKLKITSVKYNGKAIESFNEKVKQPSQTVKGTKAEFIEDFDYRKKEADAAFDFMIDYLTFIKSKNDPLLWVSTMKSLDSNMKTMLKAAANVEYYFVGDYKGELVYEHMVPTNHMMIELTNHFWNKKVDLDALKESYTVGIVPKIMDKNINVQFKSTMPINYILGQLHQTYRYYNKGTLGGKNIFALEKLGGENVGEIFGEGWVKFNSNLQVGAIAKANKNKIQQKALNNARKRSYSENPKGISVYDFDDTLAFSKSQIIVKKDDKTFKINAAQFAKQGETLLAEGAEFDFSEFNKVVKGQPGPLIPRIQKAIDKFGNNNIFILTARPVASESAIHAFMKGLGIDIPRA